jgi:hypothetical protein
MFLGGAPAGPAGTVIKPLIIYCQLSYYVCHI